MLLPLLTLDSESTDRKDHAWTHGAAKLDGQCDLNLGGPATPHPRPWDLGAEGWPLAPIMWCA